MNFDALKIENLRGGKDFKLAENSVEFLERNVHQVLWEHYIDPVNFMQFEYRDDFLHPERLPSAAEIAAEIPSPAGWATGMEDCCLNGSMYFLGLCYEYMLTGSELARERMRKMFHGLMLLATVSKTPGFLARAVLADGMSHYPNSSLDQYTMWFYAMWRYCREGLADAAEKKQIGDAMENMLRFFEEHNFSIAREDGKPGIFGYIDDPRVRHRLLFFLAAGFDVSGNPHWRELYLAKREQNHAETIGLISEPRLQHHGEVFVYFQEQIAIRCLWELEDDPRSKVCYASALRLRAEAVQQVLERKFTLDDGPDGLFPANSLFPWRKALDKFMAEYPGNGSRTLTGNRIWQFVSVWGQINPSNQRFALFRSLIEGMLVQSLAPDFQIGETFMTLLRKLSSDCPAIAGCGYSAGPSHLTLLFWSCLKEGIAEIDAKGDAKTVFTPLDLKPYCNAGFRDDDEVRGWFGIGGADDVRDLPTGRFVCEGVPFDIIDPENSGGRSAVVLSYLLPKISPVEIPVGECVDGIHILHTVGGVKAEAGSPARYEIVYEDGTVIRIPLLACRNVMPWKTFMPKWHLPGIPVIRITVPRPSCPSPDTRDRSIYLSAWYWNNPRKRSKIRNLRMVSEGSRNCAALLAVTLQSLSVAKS